MSNTWLAFAAFAAMLTFTAPGQAPGDCVRVEATHPDGVPVHARAENSFTGNRIAHSSVAEVLAVDGNWLKVRAVGEEGWIARKYVAGVVPCDAPQAGPDRTVLIGTWNLEHLHEGAARGFPEYQGAQSLPPRGDAEYTALAGIIRDLNPAILILQEVNGYEAHDEEGEVVARSAELDRLVGKLGAAYRYEIADSGGAQRVALLYDSRAAYLHWTCEPDLPNPKVNGKHLFDRQPLLGYFTLFDGGVERNDVAVVGVHLASGQALTKNHDLAIEAVTGWLGDVGGDGSCIPSGERDIVIGGDFNASRFDDYGESLWESLETSGWDVLADSPSYPATRLSGTPPAQRTSKIDYLVVSSGAGGLKGEEVTSEVAEVRSEIVGGDGLAFRRRASDHLPVTVPVRVTDDRD